MSAHNYGAVVPLVNCGFRCPISAGTDTFLNIPYHLIPRAGRVFRPDRTRTHLCRMD